MWLIFIFFASISMLVMYSGTHDYLEREKATVTRQAEVVAGKLRMFAWSAAVYVQENPTAIGNIYWDTIKTASVIPESFKSASIHPEWKIVANGAGAWVVCAPIPQDAISALNKVVGEAKSFGVGENIVYAKTAAEAATEAAKCI